MKRFIFLFMFWLLLIFAAEQIGVVKQQVIDPFTESLASLSSALVQMVDSDAYASGILLGSRSTGFAVEIRAGCNGVEAMAILIAAILAFPATWRARFIGILVGLLAIQVLNLGRIISLFYLGQWNYSVFEFFHIYLWPTLIILDALIVFLVWIKRLPSDNAYRAA